MNKDPDMMVRKRLPGGSHELDGVERERQDSYKQFDELGEVEVERRVHSGEWAERMQSWASAWLRE